MIARRLSSERGWALVVAMMVTAAIMTAGLGIYGYVDAQGKLSGKERTRESALNLAEGVLSSELYLASRNWPGLASLAYPNCSSSGWSTGLRTVCPNPASLAAGYATADYAAGMSWSTTLRDNGGTSVNFYDDAATQAQPAWDSNADGKLWLRASATVRGQTRVIIALVQVEQIDLAFAFPKNVITAGKFSTSNNGNKVIVDTRGNAAQAAPLAVRCRRADAGCLSYDARKGQVAPDTTQDLYSAGSALTPAQIDELRAHARANGTYFPAGSCPASLTGAVVFIESANCSYTGNTQFNSAAAPGTVILGDGSLSLGGTTDFFGLIYNANSSGTSGDVVMTGGNASIQGSVAVDGPGGVVAGSSKLNITYDPNAFSSLKGYGNAGVVQNTWRELIAK